MKMKCEFMSTESDVGDNVNIVLSPFSIIHMYAIIIISIFITSSLCLGISRTGGPQRLIFSRKICLNFSNVKGICRMGSTYNSYIIDS